MTAHTNYPLAYDVRVRWAEVDAQSVVFNGNYLLYADVAFTEYWRAAGYDLQSEHADLFVVKATLEYRAPARFDDLLTLRASVTRLGTSSMTVVVSVDRADEVLCVVELIYVNADAQSGTSRPLPPKLRASVDAFERTAGTGRAHALE